MLLGTNKIHLKPQSFKADDRLCFIHGEQKQLNRARLSVAQPLLATELLIISAWIKVADDSGSAILVIRDGPLLSRGSWRGGRGREKGDDHFLRSRVSLSFLPNIYPCCIRMRCLGFTCQRCNVINSQGISSSVKFVLHLSQKSRE